MIDDIVWYAPVIFNVSIGALAVWLSGWWAYRLWRSDFRLRLLNGLKRVGPTLSSLGQVPASPQGVQTSFSFTDPDGE